MANEYLFFAQLVLIIGFSFAALKAGKEALMTWVAIQAVVANLFVIKQIPLFGLQATASDAFAIGSLASLNFLQERFGREAAKKATWICFASMIFFALISQLHLLYLPSPHDKTQSAFEILLSPSPRLLVASMGAFFIVQRLSIMGFAVIKRVMPSLDVAFRTALILACAQLADTVIFCFAGLYGLVASISDVIIVSLTVKWVAIVFFTIFVRLTSWRLSISN